MKHAIPIILTMLAQPVIAGETRELDAHEHGVGELNIAVEGDTIAMELHAPGADIVGFEYAAKSAEDRAAIDGAVAALAKPLKLFVFPTSAQCSVTQASAELESDDAHNEHGHDDHDDHDDGEHADADVHDDHEEHAEGASHTEFHAEYTLTCGNLDDVSKIEFAYFDVFSNARELEVQILTSSGAQAYDVERSDPTLDLRGMF